MGFLALSLDVAEAEAEMESMEDALVPWTGPEECEALEEIGPSDCISVEVRELTRVDCLLEPASKAEEVSDGADELDFNELEGTP
jgi:hypothetical protein